MEPSFLLNKHNLYVLLIIMHNDFDFFPFFSFNYFQNKKSWLQLWSMERNSREIQCLKSIYNREQYLKSNWLNDIIALRITNQLNLEDTIFFSSCYSDKCEWCKTTFTVSHTPIADLILLFVKLWFTTMFYVGFIPWQKVL